MSTTLATNALVEGQGERAALVMIGFAEADLARGGLKAALGADPVIFCPGGHDVFGGESPLVLDGLEAALPALSDGSSPRSRSVAIFAVRNPAHEIAVRDLVRERAACCRSPMTSRAHRQARRTQTRPDDAAQCAPDLDDRGAVGDGDRGVSGERGVAAPPEDGGARRRGTGHRRFRQGAADQTHPVGTRRPSGRRAAPRRRRRRRRRRYRRHDDRRRRARQGPPAARSGGRQRRRLRTMVEAVAMRTSASAAIRKSISPIPAWPAIVDLGPRRLVPLSLAAALHGDAILRAARTAGTRGSSGRVGRPLRAQDRRARPARGGSERRRRGALRELDPVPVPLSDVMTMATRKSALAPRLVGRGLTAVAGFAVLRRCASARPPIELERAGRAPRRPNLQPPQGRPRRAGGGLRRSARRAVYRGDAASAEAILETAFAEDGLDGAATVAHRLGAARDRRARRRRAPDGFARSPGRRPRRLPRPSTMPGFPR